MTATERVNAKLRPYPAYKDSGVPWIGEVPVGWEVRRAKTLMFHIKEISNGQGKRLALTMKGVIERDEDDVNGLQPENLSGYQIFRKDDLAFKLIDLQNFKTSRVGIVPRDGIMSPAYIRLQINHRNYTRYAYWLFNAMYLLGIFNQMGEGVRQTLKAKDLLEVRVLLPPTMEQQAIATFLDRETTRIDELVREQEALLEDLGEKRRAVITKAVTEGLEQNQTTWDAGVPWLKQVPTTWKVEPLKNLVRFQGGHTPKDEPHLWDGSVPWVSPKDMKAHVIHQSEDTVSEAALHEGNLNLYPVGSVLMVVRSGILRNKIPVALNAVPVTVNQDMKVLRPSSRLDARFLQVFFEGLGPTLLPVLQKVGATVESINMAALRGLLVPVPLPEEQRTIATYLDERLAQIDTLVHEVRASIEDMRLHRSALITAAVTGKIDVRHLEHA